MIKAIPDNGFERGIRAAAELAVQFPTTHAYRLDDVILCKFNIIRRVKPRKNNRKVPPTDDTWLAGFAVALAEMHRRLLGGNDSRGVRDTARDAGLTLEVAKRVGVSPFDLRELKKAGVALARLEEK